MSRGTVCATVGCVQGATGIGGRKSMKLRANARPGLESRRVLNANSRGFNKLN